MLTSKKPLTTFNPLTVSGCALWLDAADASTITLSGSSVTQWADKSVNATNAVAGALTYPVYQSSTLNQLPIISMRATNDYFLVSNNFSPAEYPSLCYHIVMRVANTQSTNFAGVLSTHNGTTWGRSLGLGNTGTSLQQGYFGNLQNIVTCAKEVWLLVSLQFVTTVSGTMYQNGVATTAFGSPTGTNTTGLKIGSYSSAGSYATYNANFDVAEILVYGSAQTTSERQLLEGYLAWKWSLQRNLPTTHPYSKRPPAVFPPISLPYRGTTQPLYFNPLTIPNLTLWLDAADSSTISLSGTSVTGMTDKSPIKNNYTQATAGNRPTYQVDPVYKKPGILFTRGSGTNLTPSNTALRSLNSSQWTIFFVCRFSDANEGSIQTIWRGQLIGYWTRFQIPGNASFYVPGSDIQFGRTFANASGVWGSVVSSSSQTVYLNGTQTGSGSRGNTSMSDYFTLGGHGSGEGMTGYLFEFLVYNTVALSDTNRFLIEGYLAWKWGLQANLPANHLFKNGPPTPYTGLTLPAPLKVTSWKPTQITGCQVWLDAADTTSLVLSGTNVSQWKDKSGNARNFSQATSSQQPTYPGKFLLFDGVDDLLTGPDFVPVYSNPSIFNVFVVGNALTISLNNANPYDNEAFIGDSGGYHSIFLKTNTVGGYYYNSANTSLQTTQAYTANTLGIFNISLQGNLFSLYQNGTVSSVTATLPIKTSGISSVFQLGAQYATAGGFNRYLNCRIYEVVIYNTLLTVARRQQVEGYLAWKWGLVASLPSTHPYKLFPPSP